MNFCPILLTIMFGLALGLTPAQKSAKKFLISIAKHASLQNFDILHREYRKIDERSGNFVTKNDAIREASRISAPELAELKNLYRDLLNQDWHEFWTNNFARFTEDGFLLVQIYNAGGKLASETFGVPDDFIEGGFKVHRIIDY